MPYVRSSIIPLAPTLKPHRTDGKSDFDGAGKLMASFVQNIPAYLLDFYATNCLHTDATPLPDVLEGADPAYFK